VVARDTIPWNLQFAVELAQQEKGRGESSSMTNTLVELTIR
jgi:hypothetical protein